MNILVTGANGQLGKCLADISAHHSDINFHFFGRDVFPVENEAVCREVIERLKPDVLINTAAYTAVDKAETETEQAFLINSDAVGNLAAVCHVNGCRFIHVSTDYVFDGTATNPYSETDQVCPVNKYGESKLKGEELALANNPASVIVRTSWVYSIHGNNFVKTMIRLMKEREKIGVVSDQQGCPTYAIDLAEALVQIAMNPAHAGIYHFSNSGPITWHQFAMAINKLIASKCIVDAIPSSAFPTPAKRPAYSVMSNQKIEADFGILQQNWEQSLQTCIGLLQPSL